MKKLFPNNSSKGAVAFLLAVALFFTWYMGSEGDWITVIFWWVLTGMLTAVICLINFVKETRKERRAAGTL
ncbi:hypothetical protein [Rufibacter soli]